MEKVKSETPKMSKHLHGPKCDPDLFVRHIRKPLDGLVTTVFSEAVQCVLTLIGS